MVRFWWKRAVIFWWKPELRLFCFKGNRESHNFRFWRKPNNFFVETIIRTFFAYNGNGLYFFGENGNRSFFVFAGVNGNRSKFVRFRRIPIAIFWWKRASNCVLLFPSSTTCSPLFSAVRVWKFGFHPKDAPIIFRLFFLISYFFSSKNFMRSIF